MSHPVDSPERKAALAASADLAAIRAAAKVAKVGMRRLRWRVQGRICFTFQPYGTPYRDWGSLGRVYFHEDGTVAEATYHGLEVQPDAVPFALEHVQPLGVAVTGAQPGEVVEVLLQPLDAITLELATVPQVDIPVRDPETGAIEVVHVDAYLPVLEPGEVEDTSLADIATLPPWEPTVRLSWLFCAFTFLVGLLGIALVSFAAGLVEQGGSSTAGFFGIGGAVLALLGGWGVITAVRWNDRALDVSRETSGAT